MQQNPNAPNAFTDTELELFARLKELPANKIDQIGLELLKDPVLRDIKQADLDEFTEYDIDKLIAKHNERAFEIFLVKATGEKMKFIITPETTLDQLKKDVKKEISLVEEKTMVSRKINWKHVWKNYCLMYNNTRLLSPELKL